VCYDPELVKGILVVLHMRDMGKQGWANSTVAGWDAKEYSIEWHKHQDVNTGNSMFRDFRDTSNIVYLARGVAFVFFIL